jgi:hypothetical protein
VDRRDRDFADPAGLLWGINFELGNIRRWKLDRTFLLVLRCVSAVPGWVARLAARPVCRATSVVTNLGAPFERLRLPRDGDGRLCFGGLVLEEVDLVVPLRPMTPAGFAVLRYAGGLRINLHFDAAVMPPGIADELMERIAQRMSPDALPAAESGPAEQRPQHSRDGD